MRVLELFSGTHSVGKVASALGYEVVSLDLSDATICCNILEWDYKAAFSVGHFDIIWAAHRAILLVRCDSLMLGDMV